MGVNLAGANLTKTFFTSQSDPNAPYTNTGGLNKAAILTLTTSRGVVVTETANAIEETTEPIDVALSGPGEFEFEGVNIRAHPERTRQLDVAGVLREGRAGRAGWIRSSREREEDAHPDRPTPIAEAPL